MTRLDDRLITIESKLDEVQRLLHQLIAVLVEDEDGQPKPEARRSMESLVEEYEQIMADYADTDPLELQYETALNWDKSGRSEDLTEFDLSGRSMRNIDLKDAKLLRANLSRCDMTAGKLMRADLSEADISRAQMGRVDFTKAILEQADLTFTHLAYAKLEGANMRYALLTRANLVGANLGGADLGGAQLNRANLSRANLKDATFTYRQLASVSSLDGATMPDGRVYDGNAEPFKNG